MNSIQNADNRKLMTSLRDPEDHFKLGNVMKNVTKRSMVNVSRAMSSPSISSPLLSSPAMFTPAKSSVNIQPCNFSVPV